MNVRLTDRYELRTFDSMNMQLYEYREVDTSKAHRHGSEPRTEWRATGNYFQDVPSAALHVFKRMQRDDPYAGDLEGALGRMAEMAEELKKAVAA